MLANCNDLLNKNGRNGVIGVTLLGLTAYAEPTEVHLPSELPKANRQIA